MRLTVGPLPSAVYWRRRAVVLGAALLFLLVLVYSCSGPGNSGADPGDKASQTPSTQTDPTGSLLSPQTGAPPAGGEDPVGGEPVSGDDSPGSPVDVGGGAPVPTVPPQADGSCTDDEMSVIPVPSQASVKQSVTIELRLKIRNISNRTCSRDVGSDVQEIYIRLGAQVVWSSDTCSGPGESNVVSFPANIEHEYRVAWNGRDNTRCADGVADGPPPAVGEYQVFGRLGTKRSEPVKLTIVN